MFKDFKWGRYTSKPLIWVFEVSRHTFNPDIIRAMPSEGSLLKDVEEESFSPLPVCSRFSNKSILSLPLKPNSLGFQCTLKTVEIPGS